MFHEFIYEFGCTKVPGAIFLRMNKVGLANFTQKACKDACCGMPVQ